MIEDILLAACEGDRTSDKLYRQLRGIILQEPIIKPLLPSFVRTSVPAVTSITSGPTSRAKVRTMGSGWVRGRNRNALGHCVARR